MRKLNLLLLEEISIYQINTILSTAKKNNPGIRQIKMRRGALNLFLFPCSAKYSPTINNGSTTRESRDDKCALKKKIILTEKPK
jgi:hypothetical protein